MANPTTTHVIEIEAGIGEPAFIPLSMGNELQPISVGKKGMWRLESARVLDVHAFLYFDGTSLFLQSADEANAASVDGYRIGKAWTELHSPCMIEVGNARLRFRSLIDDDENQATQIAMSPPVRVPAGGPGGPGSPLGDVPLPPPPNGAPGVPTQPPAAGRPPTVKLPTSPVPSDPPIAFPKADRPFKPGEFTAPPDDESTRIAPLESTGANRVPGGASRETPYVNSGLMHVQGPMAAPVQSLGFPNGPMGPGMGSAPGMIGPGMGSAPGLGSQPGMMGGMGSAPGMVPAALGSQPGMGYDPNQGYGPPPGYDPNQQQGSYPNGGPYPNGYPNNSGQYGALGPGMPPMGGPQGGYPTNGPSGTPTPMQQFVEKLKANSIPKMIAGLLFVVGGVLYLAEDDEEPPKKRPVAALDAGTTPSTSASVTSATSTSTVPPVQVVDGQAPLPTSSNAAWPPGVPCPPPNWPPNTPLPCNPATQGAGATNDTSPQGGRPGTDPKDTPSRATRDPATKSLERQAVDFVAAGDTQKAAAAYEELVRREPNNKVYAEAARILRAKLDAGAPQ